MKIRKASDEMDATNSARLNRTKDCASIISHLHERGFSMNNSIDLLFQRRISLGMYHTSFSFFFRDDESWRDVDAREGPQFSFHDPFYISRLSRMMFCKSYFYNSSVLQMCTLYCYTASRIDRSTLSQLRFHCNCAVTICEREYK